MLGAARVLLGFGMGMEFPVAQSIVSEIIPAGLRGRYLALLEGFWPLGFIAAGLIAHAVLPVGGWRWVFLIEATPAVFVFIVRFMVPESPRWLAVRGRMAEADDVVRKFERAVSARVHGGVLPETRPEPAERAAGARATGAGFASAIGRLGSLLGPFAVGVILPLAGQAGVFAFAAGAFLLAALIVVLLGTETRGKTLEMISA